MTDMRESLITAEIRRATNKATWYEQQGHPAHALEYRAYVQRLRGYPPAVVAQVLELREILTLEQP